ncbi:MAG: ABC transporter substrate-binding protein [Ketobacteraceae bacterium]|nr:ABC transporter substrate-binding protein [Ketobacteraceae bacterium]
MSRHAEVNSSVCLTPRTGRPSALCWREQGFTGLVVLGLLMLSLQVHAEPLQPVTLQLKWQHQFQFAGYYAAREKGFYKDVGLDVTILPATPGTDVIRTVLDGGAEFGVGTSELILHRARGEPVVVLAVILQHSPLNLIALEASGIRSIHDLVGKKVMIEPNSAELMAYFNCEGFDLKALELYEHTFHTPDVIEGKVDAMSVYITDEPFELKKNQIEYQLFTPRSCAIDFYGDNLFTLEHVINRDPRMVRAFRAATLKGWEYAMENPEEIISLIHEAYPGTHTVDHLRYEAEKMQELMRPELIEPGYMTAGRWQHMLNTYQKVGLVSEGFDVSDMLYTDPNVTLHSRLRVTLLLVAGAFALCLLVLFTVSYFYRHLKASSNRLQTMFEYAPFSMIVLDERFGIQHWNRHAEQTFQWQSQEVQGRSLPELVVPVNLRPEVEARLSKVLRHNCPVTSENPNLRKDGEEIICEWTNAPFQDRHNQTRFIVCIARDITARRRLEQELEKAAHYDNLTGLANRRLILELLKNAMATARRMDKKLAVLFLDLDDFKPVNDAYGHQLGDEVLITLARRLHGIVRESDFAGRLAGDEFLVILQDVHSREDAEKVARKIQDAVSEPCQFDAAIIHISVSIGIALYPDDGETLDGLVMASDKAMYESKEDRKNGHQKKKSAQPSAQPPAQPPDRSPG